jgi:hypothetical protein
VHRDEVLEDSQIRVVIEVGRTENQRDLVANFRQEENAPENCLLGFDAAGRLTVKDFGRYLFGVCDGNHVESFRRELVSGQLSVVICDICESIATDIDY